MMRKGLIIGALLLGGFFLLTAVAEMPRMGDPSNPPLVHVADRYIKEGAKEADAENIVTTIVLNYRGYDTMGEVTVIFTALCSVLAILKREKRKTSYSKLNLSPLKPSLIVRTVTASFIPFIILFAIYVILHGDVSPGGGFQGGTILGASLIVFAVIFGLMESIKKMPAQARVFFEGAAVLSFGLVGLIGLISGVNFLTFRIPQLSPDQRHLIAHWLLLFLEIGIGIGGAAVFTSIFFSMHREERA